MTSTIRRITLVLAVIATNLHAMVHTRTIFASSRHTRSVTSQTGDVSLHATVDEEIKHEKKSRETLRFAGDLTFCCESVPDATYQEMVRFLIGDDCRRLLLSAGGTRDVESLPHSADLQRMWSMQVSSGFAENIPENGDKFLRTDTVVRFPGLRLTNTVVNGFVVDRMKSSAPECVSLLIGESRATSGRKPLVWLFNKLTGDGQHQQPQEYSQPKARVVTRTSVVEREDGATFQVDVRFQVLIDFPKTLLRFLPASKEKMEAKGSAAIKRAMSKDFEKAIKGVRRGFLEYYASS